MGIEELMACLDQVYTVTIDSTALSNYVQAEATFNGLHYGKRVEWMKDEDPPHDLIRHAIATWNLFAAKKRLGE